MSEPRFTIEASRTGSLLLMRDGRTVRYYRDRDELLRDAARIEAAANDDLGRVAALRAALERFKAEQPNPASGD